MGDLNKAVVVLLVFCIILSVASVVMNYFLIKSSLMNDNLNDDSPSMFRESNSGSSGQVGLVVESSLGDGK